MARSIRVEFDDAVYHITARGNERRAIFWDDLDRDTFLKTLQQAIEQFGLQMHCYCLMPNHYHLVVQTPRGNLSRAIGWLQTTYTIRFNRRHKRAGHLFQGRFKAHLVEADAYARQLVLYIHLNPVRPRDKRAQVPSDKRKLLEHYRWCSHRSYASNQKPPTWLTLDWLTYWSNKRHEAHQKYRKDIDAAFDKPALSPWHQLRGGLLLGGDPLWQKVRNMIGDKEGQEEIRWKDRQERETIRKRVAAVLAKETDPRIQIWARVRIGEERGVDVARERHYRFGSAVWQIIARLEEAAKTQTALRAKLQALREKCEV